MIYCFSKKPVQLPLISFTITGSFPVLSVIGTLRYFMSDSLLIRKLIDTTAVLYFSAFALVRGLLKQVVS